MGKGRNAYLPRDVGGWRGLLDPVNRNDQLPGKVPDPSRYLPTNSNAGSGYNTLAQVLAQGQSPRVGQYYSPANFRDPNRQLGSLMDYAPRQITSQIGNNVPNNWQQIWGEWLRNRGVGQPNARPESNAAVMGSPDNQGMQQQIQELLRLMMSAGGSSNLGLGR